MSQKVREQLCSHLEAIPERTVLIMTTNKPEKFESRLIDRCSAHLEFKSESSAEVLADGQALLSRLWSAEHIPGEVPDVSTIPGLEEDGHISYRRMVRYVENAGLMARG